MFDNRSVRLDLVALGVLAGCLLAGMALVSYDPADPPGTLIYPPLETVHNSCGRVGAYAAHLLLAGLGYGAWYAVGSAAAVAVLLLRHRELNQPVLRGVGWGMTLAGLATLMALVLPNSSPGPEAGAGGYLGAMGFALLDANFATAGSLILALSALLAGLLLCTDYLLVRLAAKTTVASGTSLVQLAKAGQKLAAAAPTGRKNDLDAGPADEEEDEEIEGSEEATAAEDDAEAESELRVKTPATKAQQRELDEAENEAEEGVGEVDVESDEESADGEDADDAAQAAGAGAAPSAEAQTPVKNRRDRGARSERDEVIDQLEAADSQGVQEFDYQMPPLDLLLPSDDVSYEEQEKEVRRKARVLEKTFKNFGFNVKVVEIETGPVIAQFEVELEAGLRLSRITGLSDDLAIALRVPSVRIVAPIPGKNTVGIEVPNENRQLVRLREVIEEANGRAKRLKIPIFLGKDVAGNPLVVDLTAMPHLLIAGRTGTGKSVCLNSIIVSMLMTRGPDEVRMLMIDPKMVELSGYKKLPHLMHPVVTDMRKAEAILAWAVDKMEERYALLARAGVRHVTVYNQLSEEELRERIEPTSEVEWESIPRNLPFIVIVADEIADLMMTSGKEVEQHIIRLAQKSRAVGIHLILATQKPTVDVITGLIKSNLPARIAFQVASRTDSRVVLDEMGADKLLGNGDMLFLSPGTSQLLRGQGTYLSDDEITTITDFVATDSPQFARELIELKAKDEQEMAQPGELKNRDELYEAAVDVVVRERRGSVSLLQRCLGIGYGRAARLIDYMAEDGIVGDYNGSQAREVVISIEDWEAMAGGGAGASGATGAVNREAASGGSETALPPLTRGANASAPTPAATPSVLTAATVPPKPRRTNKFFPSDEPSDLEEPADEAAPWEDDEADVAEEDASEIDEETDESADDVADERAEEETDEEYDYEEEAEDGSDVSWDDEEEADAADVEEWGAGDEDELADDEDRPAGPNRRAESA